MFQLLFGGFLLRELPVPFTGHHDITSVWAGSQPPAFAAQPHAILVYHVSSFHIIYFINFIINTVKLNIVHTMDIHNVILTINPRLLGIGSILLNAKIMHINVLMFIVYDIFLYS